MENPEDDGVFLHSFRPVPSPRLSRDGSVGSESAGHGEPDQENRAGPANMASIEFRMQHLNNRRLLLLKMRRCTKKEEQQSGGSKEEHESATATCWLEEEVIPEDDENDELRAIQKELEELKLKEEELERTGVAFTASSDGDPKLQRPSYKQMPHGGIYMLPPPQPAGGAPAVAEGAPDGIRPAASLGRTSGVTQCPSCKEVVATETHSTVSETMWILCFLCSMIGCVAGCCLIPFRVKRLRSFHHHCPRCKAKIHTHQPL